jgi:hypothetical protein
MIEEEVWLLFTCVEMQDTKMHFRGWKMMLLVDLKVCEMNLDYQS